MHLRKPVRRGNVLALVAIALIALLGVTALAIDGAMLMAQRRSTQAAADAAALAAAIQMFNDWPSQGSAQQGNDPGGTAATSAKKTSADNGYADGTNGVSVAVHIPPTSGDHSGAAGYAEVIISYPQKRFFSNVFGSGDINVQSRAVARGSQTQPGIGLLVLNTSSSNAVQLSAAGDVNVANGSVVVNSNSSTGLHLSASGNLTALTIKTSTTSSPGYYATALGSVNGTVSYNQPITPDPLASFAASNVPSTSGMPDYGSITIGSVGAVGTTYSKNGNIWGTVTAPNTLTINPGNYSGNFTCFHITNDGFVLNMASGVYRFGGNMTFNGYGTVNSGTGGTLWYIASGSFTNISQNVVINLSPMTTGIYSDPAIAVWQDASDSSQFNSAAGGNLNISTGIFYVPNTSAVTRLNASVGTTANLGSQVIVGQLALTGSGSFNVDVNVTSAGAPGRNLYLVE